MSDQERTFISYMESKHPLLQEMPQNFRSLWFKKFQLPTTKEFLFLQMERIFGKTPEQFVDTLTFEIADVDSLTEWEEEYPEKPFIALDPSVMFFDGLYKDGRAMFSIGDLNRETMEFLPELEIFMNIHIKGIEIDFGDGLSELWILCK